MDGPSRNQGAPSLPSWLVSAAVHAACLVVLGLIWQTTPRGAAEEQTRRGGIVLKQIHEDGEFYQDEDDLPASDAVAQTSPANLQQAALEWATRSRRPVACVNRTGQPAARLASDSMISKAKERGSSTCSIGPKACGACHLLAPNNN